MTRPRSEMTSIPPSTSTPETAGTPMDAVPLTRRELAYIAAFWTVFAFLTVANRLFGDRGGDGNPAFVGQSFTRASVIVAVVEALCWAVLTPALFALAARVGTDRTARARQIAIFLGVGIGVAFLMTALGTGMRESLFPPRRGSHGPPIWFAFTNSLVMYGGVLATGLARAYSLRYGRREQHASRLEAQLAGAQLDALRRQLDPHFLFNTLNLISSLVERDPRGVRRMISRLSELLRFSLEGASAPEIPLRQELALLERYLDIMRMRFEDRLTVVTRADDRALDALVPSLVLQPLVENAIKHGVERMRGPGRIEVDASVDGDVVVLSVRDNGPDRDAADAMPNAMIDANGGSSDTDRAGTGVGLRNTAARLHQLHGDAGRVTLRRDGAGTVAEVRLPLRVAPESATREAGRVAGVR